MTHVPTGIPPQRVELDDAEAKAFQDALGKRRACLEAAETVARSFAVRVEQANEMIQRAYASAASKYGIDLARCGYEYDHDTNELVLKAVRFD